MIETRREGPAVWLTIARPEASNALSRGVVDGLRAELKRLASDTSVRAVVLTGAGDKVFCGGADLKERRGMTPAETRNFLDDLNALMNELEALPLPTIAAIAGGAFGGGLELALCCDFRLAAPGIQLGLTEVRLGIIPGAGGTQRLPRAVSKAKAMDMCLTARMMDAAEAERAGLVSRIFPADQLLDETIAAAQKIAGFSLPVIMMIKEAVNRAYESSLAEGLLFERRAFHAAFALDDQKEGMRAFIEKRPARFEDR